MNTKKQKMKENRSNSLNDYLFMKYMGEKGNEEQLLSIEYGHHQKSDEVRKLRCVCLTKECFFLFF
jgi:hypothetical protein